MQVAIVHDDLVQWGGAERILTGLCEIFPDTPIFTSVVDWSNVLILKNFKHRQVIPSFMQKIPGWKHLYKTLLPLYPLAFEQFDFSSFDLVISHTTRFAKSIITKPNTKHICFCHTPPRFLWHFSGLGNYGLGEVLMTKLRIYDQISARRVDYFIAGSENAQKRIKKIYKVNAKVVYPFVDLDRFKDIETFDGGYYVTLGRPAKYKRFDIAQNVCNKLGIDLKVIGGSLSDQLTVNILAGCKALIIPGVEDFGLASIEAQALGKPVIALGFGGALETVIDNKTGILFKYQTEESLYEAIKELDSIKIRPEDSRQNAQKFSKENFIHEFKQYIATL